MLVLGISMLKPLDPTCKTSERACSEGPGGLVKLVGVPVGSFARKTNLSASIGVLI